jgi:hypothetical protein
MALENILVNTDVEGVRVRSLTGDGASVHFRFGQKRILNTHRQPAWADRRKIRRLGFGAQSRRAVRGVCEWANEHGKIPLQGRGRRQCSPALNIDQPSRKMLILRIFNKRSSPRSQARLAASSPASSAFTRRVAIAAIHRAIATRFKGHGRWLATTRTNHRCSL